MDPMATIARNVLMRILETQSMTISAGIDVSLTSKNGWTQDQSLANANSSSRQFSAFAFISVST